MLIILAALFAGLMLVAAVGPMELGRRRERNAAARRNHFRQSLAIRPVPRETPPVAGSGWSFMR